MCSRYVTEYIKERLAIRELISDEVIDHFQGTPMGVIVYLRVLVEHALLSTHREITLHEVVGNELLKICHAVEKPDLLGIVVYFIGHCLFNSDFATNQMFLLLCEKSFETIDFIKCLAVYSFS